jgi:hypothetical protein
MRSRSAELRRCRQPLGTFVEVTAAGLDEATLDEAIKVAFAGVECVQRRLLAIDLGESPRATRRSAR